MRTPCFRLTFCSLAGSDAELEVVADERELRRESESIVEKVPVRAIEVEFGSRQTRLSNGSGCVRARQAGQAMKHAMQHALAAGVADSVASR